MDDKQVNSLESIRDSIDLILGRLDVFEERLVSIEFLLSGVIGAVKSNRDEKKDSPVEGVEFNRLRFPRNFNKR